MALEVDCSIMVKVGTFFDIDLTQFVAYITYVSPDIYQSTQDKILHTQF